MLYLNEEKRTIIGKLKLVTSVGEEQHTSTLHLILSCWVFLTIGKLLFNNVKIHMCTCIYIYIYAYV